MEKSEKGNIEFLLKLTPLIPLITGIIISLGILKLFAFYIVFQINILHYITISESLLASLDFLILTFLILPIAIFIASFIPMSEKKVSKDESLISRLAEIDNSLKRKFFYIRNLS